MAWNLVSTATERSAADLYEACARDDESAIDEFVRRYQPELALYARRRGAEDPEGMADLATFDTVRRLADMRSTEEPAVRAYLYRALKGRLIDERRGSVAQVSIANVPIDGLGVELATDGPESPVLDQLEFSEMLELLTPAEREVVSHRFVAGYTSVETAARVGRSPDAVRRLQSNAIARLRVALAVAAFLAVAGAGYWLASSDQMVRTTDPIGEPTERQLPDAPRRSSGRSSNTPGPAINPTPTGNIADSEPVTSPAEPGDVPPTTATLDSTIEPSTTGSTSEPAADGAAASSEQRPAAAVTTPSATNPATTAPIPSAPTTSTPPTTSAPTTGPTTTGPTTTSGDTAETTTTRPSDDRGRGRGNRGRGPGNGGPVGGPGRGPGGGQGHHGMH